jgi:hypothetical protein
MQRMVMVAPHAAKRCATGAWPTTSRLLPRGPRHLQDYLTAAGGVRCGEIKDKIAALRWYAAELENGPREFDRGSRVFGWHQRARQEGAGPFLSRLGPLIL